MILLKDLDNVLSNVEIDRHVLLNYDDYATEHNTIDLFFQFENYQDLSNQHYNITELAQKDPPFIIDPSLNDDDFYPVFWFAEYVKSLNTDIAVPGNKIPAFYKYENRNTFFLAIKKVKGFSRFEDAIFHDMRYKNIMRCQIFYKERE